MAGESQGAEYAGPVPRRSRRSEIGRPCVVYTSPSSACDGVSAMHHCNLPLIMIAVLPAAILPAERLPVRNYTSLDGLPGISVHRIVPDSKGFLWFCTNEGVSRFDGYGFVNYGRANGLSDPITRTQCPSGGRKTGRAISSRSRVSLI